MRQVGVLSFQRKLSALHGAVLRIVDDPSHRTEDRGERGSIQKGNDR
ncbi:hypothetical protein ACPOL_4966 [Acidisarcina polymorpha]|uniref:Uncharacterized protein n=1 Tax=Acidisarcina polymorpha TaxID=2211140 RepID=A0A2Z5G557_9BACT|nr:hypothetical protein ACPOL_4966 [Acidisarcina polymorpha]